MTTAELESEIKAQIERIKNTRGARLAGQVNPKTLLVGSNHLANLQCSRAYFSTYYISVVQPFEYGRWTTIYGLKVEIEVQYPDRLLVIPDEWGGYGQGATRAAR